MDVGGLGIRLDWLNKPIEKVHEGKELHQPYQKVSTLKTRVKEMEQMIQ